MYLHISAFCFLHVALTVLLSAKHLCAAYIAYQGDGQVMNWDRELQNTLVTSTGEAWQNAASESEDSSRSGSESRADRSIPR